MTTGQIINAISAVLGLTCSLYIIFSISLRSINKTIENKINQLEKDVIDEIDKKLNLAKNTTNAG